MAVSLILILAASGWKIASSPRVPPRTPLSPSPALSNFSEPIAPTDAVRLRHLYLTPQHGAALTACHAMADRLGFAVPCPELLPADAVISSPGCCIFRNPKVAPLFVLDDHFTAPSGYPPAEAGIGAPQGHLVILAERQGPLTSALACEQTLTEGPGPPIWGLLSAWQLCPGPGTNTHHVALEWEANGIAYSVSLHGDTDENRTAVYLIAESLDRIAPGTGSGGA